MLNFRSQLMWNNQKRRSDFSVPSLWFHTPRSLFSLPLYSCANTRLSVLCRVTFHPQSSLFDCCECSGAPSWPWHVWERWALAQHRCTCMSTMWYTLWTLCMIDVTIPVKKRWTVTTEGSDCQTKLHDSEQTTQSVKCLFMLFVKKGW